MIVKKNREDPSSSQNAFLQAENFSKREGVYILFEQIFFSRKSRTVLTQIVGISTIIEKTLISPKGPKNSQRGHPWELENGFL